MTVRRSTVGKGPGKYWRKGISPEEFFDLFADDEAAERLFIRARWPHGDISCRRCGGDKVYEPGGKALLRFRCRPCRRFFSTRSATVMRGSTLGYRKWLLALFVMLTNLKGVSSVKLHRDLKIRQPSAWHLAHRIREAWDTGSDIPLSGPSRDVAIAPTAFAAARELLLSAERQSSGVQQRVQKSLAKTGQGLGSR